MDENTVVANPKGNSARGRQITSQDRRTMSPDRGHMRGGNGSPRAAIAMPVADPKLTKEQSDILERLRALERKGSVTHT